MKRMLSVLLALVLCASCLTGCGGNSAAQTPEESENGKILPLAVDTFPATMDPHEFSTIDEYCIDYNTYEPLVYVMDDGSVKNILAESYEISEDATQYTFKLRSGVKFHNGETMTADDVVFSINRAIEDPHMATYVSSISDVEKVDDSTVRVILSAPNAAFLRLGKYITILNESFCSEHESLSSVACGTGPYMLTDYQDGVSLTLSAFADYWDGAAEEIDGAVYNFIADSATLVLAFETGDLDYINVPAADWDRISSDDSYKSESVTQDFVNWIVFNSEVAPLDDVRVRQAVACAINKEDVITMACNGVGTVANVLADPRIIDGGRRQRIGVARALALQPKFIVCDEPVSALDVSIQAQILNLLMDLQEEMNLTYLFITHDLSVVKHISDEIAVMYLGMCIKKARSEELFANPTHPYTKALLSAIPIPDPRMRKTKREVIRGEVTSPINPKPGCRFAVRCPYASERCFAETPELRDIGDGHLTACHLACTDPAK